MSCQILGSQIRLLFCLGLTSERENICDLVVKTMRPIWWGLENPKPLKSHFCGVVISEDNQMRQDKILSGHTLESIGRQNDVRMQVFRPAFSRHVTECYAASFILVKQLANIP
jgi:hypothetical protein